MKSRWIRLRILAVQLWSAEFSRRYPSHHIGVWTAATFRPTVPNPSLTPAPCVTAGERPEVDCGPLTPSWLLSKRAPPPAGCTFMCLLITTVAELNKTGLKQAARFMCHMCLCPWTQLISCPTSAPHKHPNMCVSVCVFHAFDCMCVYTQASLRITPHISSRASVCVCVFLLSERVEYDTFGFSVLRTAASYTHRVLTELAAPLSFSLSAPLLF